MAAHDDLMATAVDQTGLDDFGDDSFREGLERLARSLQDEAHLNAIGQVALQGQLVTCSRSACRSRTGTGVIPRSMTEPIDAPLIGLGLPRTGSTALSFLLAEDPSARSLRLWESAQPCPPPSTVDATRSPHRMAELRASDRERCPHAAPRSCPRPPPDRWSARS